VSKENRKKVYRSRVKAFIPWDVRKASERPRDSRPVTWIGGGGQDPAALALMGVPELHARFLQMFGQHTASNNSIWLRKKLAEPVAQTGPIRPFTRGSFLLEEILEVRSLLHLRDLVRSAQATLGRIQTRNGVGSVRLVTEAGLRRTTL
jgi:hypothetical protein